MNKREYVAELRRMLEGLPDEEVDRAVEFYAEAIEDRVEAGESEEGAVASMETPAEAAGPGGLLSRPRSSWGPRCGCPCWWPPRRWWQRRSSCWWPSSFACGSWWACS